MKTVVNGIEREMTPEEVAEWRAAEAAAIAAAQFAPKPAEDEVAALKAALAEQTRRLDAVLASIANAR